jgi:hypothetical protein
MHGFGSQIIHDEPALGSERDLVAASGQCPADERLVVTIAVDIGRVEQGDTQIDRLMNSRYRLVLVTPGLGIGPAHAHATQPNRADLRAALSKRPFTHPHHLFHCSVWQ